MHSAVPALGHLRVTGGGDLIDAVRAVHHPGARRAEHQQRARQQFRQLGLRDADNLARSACRIRQWAEKIERRSDSKLPPGWSSVLHRRMKRRREEERDASVTKRTLD